MSPTGRKTLGRYALRYLVAQGGMASVYLAQLNSGNEFRKWVAIKTIHEHTANDPRFVQMFLDEARLAARLDHPNICTVFDFGQADGTYYLAMEYLAGETLHGVVRRAKKNGGMPVAIALRIVAEAARGLHFAHELRMNDGSYAEIVHRDVSPQNLFVLYSGVTKVMDFGIARSREHQAETTRTGEVKGKYAYMSPEQVMHNPLDRRTDIWSLGVVLWEALTGERLFRREVEAATLISVLQDEIVPPSKIRADFPAALDRMVMKALKRDPDGRYPTAQEFARQIETQAAQNGMHASTDDVAEYMQTLFSAEVEQRRKMLQNTVEDAPVQVVDVGSHSSANTGRVSAVSAAAAAIAAKPPLGWTAPPKTETGPVGSSVVEPLPPPRPDPPDSWRPLPPDPPRRDRTLVYVGLILVSSMLAAVATVVVLNHNNAHTPPVASAPAAVNAPVAAPPPPSPNVPPPPVAAAPAPAPAPATAPAVPVPPPAPVAPVARANTPRGTSHSANTAPAPAPATTPSPAPAPAPAPARAANDTATEPADTAGTGYLTMYSDPPGAQVYDGSTLLGRTPIVDRGLRAGPHSLRVVPPGDGAPRNASVTLRPGMTSVLRVRWQPQAPANPPPE